MIPILTAQSEERHIRLPYRLWPYRESGVYQSFYYHLQDEEFTMPTTSVSRVVEMNHYDGFEIVY
jgi:hypothetical protein